MMKIHAIVAAALLVPVVSFAQQSQAPMTRADVRAQLVQIEQAGYSPFGKHLHYPDEIQAAEARVSGPTPAMQRDMSGYGAMPDASSQSGPTPGTGMDRMQQPMQPMNPMQPGRGR